ncbi:MAG: iron transporter [Chloroflexi bacterium]|nr:iron transporter [Chloroflexota bacterium]
MATRNKSYALGLAVLIVAIPVLVGCASSARTTGVSGQAAEQSNKGGKTAAPAAGFTEYPIGDEVEIEGLSIAAVYFQPVDMEPSEKAGLKREEADIHIEADIKALEGNQTGFGIGEFVPYLTVKYKMQNLDSGKETEGTFMPMNAADGPHYGANLKMMGAGKYKLTYTIESPEKQAYLLHVDEDTGVPGRFWRKPIEVSWEFNFVPRKW